MLLGYHVSIAGGLHNAFKNATDLESNVIQIFVSSPQMWTMSTITSEQIALFKQAQTDSQVEQVLVHAAYLPNIASHKDSLRNFSLKKLKDEIKTAYAIGADGYNLHCGSNQNSDKEGIQYAIQTLNRLAELTEDNWPIKLILENDAGAGNKIGDTIEELAAIWKGLKNKERFGFCLDTCHLFASGIDIRTKKDISSLFSKFDKLIGLKHLKFMHVSDAKFGLGSKKDRHANIGEGEIGEEGFRNLINHPKLKKIPFILETPRTGNIQEDLKDIKLLRKLIK